MLPDDRALIAGLASVLGVLPSTIILLDRRPHEYTSTFPMELVSCEAGGGVQHHLFIKYSADTAHPAFGHRGGVPYEASVYQRVLEPLAMGTPKCHGVYEDPQTGWTWLVLQYIDHAMRCFDEPESIVDAAAWIGRFHAACESVAVQRAQPWLKSYDAAYLSSWLERALEFSQKLPYAAGWLATAAPKLRDAFAEFVEHPATIIHGEYYVKNILVRGAAVHPVDWESAALSRGEIDLACLTDNWDEQTKRACRAAYCEARWSGDTPSDFDRALDLARIYVSLRWLGDRPYWTTCATNEWRFAEVKAMAERCG